MTEQPQASPYKVEEEKPETSFTVLENGDVLMTQVRTHKMWFNPREFQSVKRDYEKSRENAEYNLSDNFKSKMEEQISEINNDLKRIAPVARESEEKAKAQYEAAKIEGITGKLRENGLNNKKFDEDWFKKIWSPLKSEMKEKVLKSLSKEEQDDFRKRVRPRLKRKGIL